MPEPEKITINLAAVDLGKIDLLVEEGLYSNRTDFIRTAIRNLLDKHTFEIQQSVTRRSSIVGALVYNKADLDKYRVRGEKLDLKIVGFLNLTEDVSPELAQEVIESIQVRGVLHASPAVKAALAGRMK